MPPTVTSPSIMYLADLKSKPRAYPYPYAVIGYLLKEHEDLLQTMCFYDNEIGDKAKANEAYALKVVPAMNDRLERSAHCLHIVSVQVQKSRHHTVDVVFQQGIRQNDEEGSILVVDGLARVSLFMPSKKALAMERKADADGEKIELTAPRRGESPGKSKRSTKNRIIQPRRQKQKMTCADPISTVPESQ